MATQLIISHEDQKDIVQDLTTLFNGLAQMKEDGQLNRGPYEYKETPSEIHRNILNDFTTYLDFEIGNSNLRGSVARNNSLNSAKLSAIEIIQELDKIENQTAVAALYQVMEEVAKENNFSFRSAYKARNIPGPK